MALLVISACSSGPDIPELLEKNFKSEAVPLEGFYPDFVIEDTSYKEFISAMGSGQLSLGLTDDATIFEHAYAGQFTFFFESDDLCFSELRMINTRELFKMITFNSEKFFNDYSECENITLSRIKIKAPYFRDDSFYKGSLPSEIELYDTLETALIKDSELRQSQALEEDFILVDNPNPRIDPQGCEQEMEELCPKIKILEKVEYYKEGLQLKFALEEKKYNSPMLLKEITLRAY